MCVTVSARLKLTGNRHLFVGSTCAAVATVLHVTEKHSISTTFRHSCEIVTLWDSSAKGKTAHAICARKFNVSGVTIQTSNSSRHKSLSVKPQMGKMTEKRSSVKCAAALQQSALMTVEVGMEGRPSQQKSLQKTSSWWLKDITLRCLWREAQRRCRLPPWIPKHKLPPEDCFAEFLRRWSWTKCVDGKVGATWDSCTCRTAAMDAQ